MISLKWLLRIGFHLHILHVVCSGMAVSVFFFFVNCFIFWLIVLYYFLVKSFVLISIGILYGGFVCG